MTKIDPGSIRATAIRDLFKGLGQIVGEVNVANGWDTSRAMMADPGAFHPKHHVAHKIAELGLIDTETSEAIEEVRAGRAMDEMYYSGGSFGLEDERTPLSTDSVDAAGRLRKPEGVPAELADVVIRVLDIADAYGIDLGAAVIAKLNHNATRGMHHGGKAL